MSASDTPGARRRRCLWEAGASLFVLWHLGAIVLGPAPASYLAGELYPWYKPYLELLHLDNPWGFFAPDPTYGRAVRYVVEDRAGARHEFRLTEALARSQRAYLRYTSLSSSLIPAEPRFLRSAADYLCREHAALRPAHVVIVLRHQSLITPDDYLQGLRPLQDGVTESQALDPLPCP